MGAAVPAAGKRDNADLAAVPGAGKRDGADLADVPGAGKWGRGNGEF